MITIVEATSDHAHAIDLRDGDAREVGAFGLSQEESVTTMIRHSAAAFCALDGGKPLMIWGIQCQSLIGHTAHLWALSGKGIERHRKELLRRSYDFVEGMQDRFYRLEAMVDPTYEQGRRWVRWLGFEDGDWLTIGGRVFVRVWRERYSRAAPGVHVANEWVH